jgi:hypothetical protein
MLTVNGNSWHITKHLVIVNNSKCFPVEALYPSFSGNIVKCKHGYSFVRHGYPVFSNRHIQRISTGIFYSETYGMTRDWSALQCADEGGILVGAQLGVSWVKVALIVACNKKIWMLYRSTSISWGNTKTNVCFWCLANLAFFSSLFYLGLLIRL